MSETGFDYLSENEFATFTSNETKWINKIKKLANERPDEVNILLLPENNYGYILAHVPKTWFKLSPPRQMNFTDEQKATIAERLAAARSKSS